MRGVVGVVTVSIVLLSWWAMASRDVATAAVTEGPGIASSTALTFDHGESHVDEVWLDEKEVPRDCRGCHDYGNADPTRHDPARTCDACHLAPGGGSALTVSGSVTSRRKQGRPFRHAPDHGKLECKSCHMEPGRRLDRVPNEMWIPDGVGWCMDCHDADPKTEVRRHFPPATRRRWKPDALSAKGQKGFQDGMNACATVGPHPDAVFSHLDHMSRNSTRDMKQGKCKDCHAGILDAVGSDFGEKMFSEKGCGDCHLKARGQGAHIAATLIDQPSLTKATFFHGDHDPAKAETADRADLEKECLTCHTFRSVEGRLTFDTAEPLRSFDGCVACHHHEQAHKWTKEQGPDHGDVKSCVGCHVVGRAVDMKEVRPTRRIRRKRPSVFEIKTQMHPHISGATTPVTETCSKCHVAKVKELPSRITSRRFRHASHIDPKATAKEQLRQCGRCHTPDERTGMMEKSGSQGTLTYDEKACDACHLGSRPVRATEWTDDDRDGVVAFPHDVHIRPKSGADPVGCGECHVTTTSDNGREFGFADGVTDCRKCHNHRRDGKDAFMDRTAHVDQKWVESCNACHKAPSASGAKLTLFPEADQVVTVKRRVLKSIDDKAFHPLPRDSHCGSCHHAPKTASATPQPLVIERKGYAEGGYHKLFPHNNVRCLECHWNKHSGNDTKYFQAMFRDGRRIDVGRMSAAERRRRLGGGPHGFQGSPR